MKIHHLCVVFPLVAATVGFSVAAIAGTHLFRTEPEATQACGVDPVVWIDLDKGRFYEKTQADYSKTKNGGYTCLKVAHTEYRPGHSD